MASFPHDHDAAVRYYQLAADQGHVEAQANLAGLYEAGRGVPKDNALAFMWYGIAATRGSLDALSLRRKLATKIKRQPGGKSEWQKMQTRLTEAIEKGVGQARRFSAVRGVLFRLWQDVLLVFAVTTLLPRVLSFLISRR